MYVGNLEEMGYLFMEVYADNAATTQMSAVAKNAVIECMNNYYGNPSSLHTIGQVAAEKLSEARKTIADYLNAEPDEIYFTSGGSEADNQAIISAVRIGERKGKKHIITTAIEHHAVLHTLKKLEKKGFEVTYLDVHDNGIVTAEQVEDAIREDTALVTIMYANNEIGTIQPINQIGKICRSHGILFHTDAVQAAGHVPIDVVKENIDMLSLSAHKFHGPKGAGVLYAAKGIAVSNIIEGGAQERGKRAGTENLPAIVGMAEAFVDSCRNIDRNTSYITELREMLIENLNKIPHSVLNGDRKNRLPGTVNMCFEGIEGESLLLLLDAKGIAASSGSACTSGSLDPSHVLLALGLPHEVAHGSLRLSVCELNTKQEIEHIIRSVTEVVSYLRNISPVWDELVNGQRKHII